jgi:hypothetical protein
MGSEKVGTGKAEPESPLLNIGAGLLIFAAIGGYFLLTTPKSDAQPAPPAARATAAADARAAVRHLARARVAAAHEGWAMCAAEARAACEADSKCSEAPAIACVALCQLGLVNDADVALGRYERIPDVPASRVRALRCLVNAARAELASRQRR